MEDLAAKFTTNNNLYMGEIPNEVFKAAQTVFEWTEKNGWKDWSIGSVSSRKYLHKLESELSDLRSKLAASKAGAAEMRKTLQKVQWLGSDSHQNSKCPACDASHWIDDGGDEPFKHRNVRVHKSDCWILAALSSTAGADLLREMEELRNELDFTKQRLKHYDDVPVEERAGYISLQLTGHKILVKELEQKLKVATEAFNNIIVARYIDPRPWEIAEQALALLNETSKDSVGGEEEK